MLPFIESQPSLESCWRSIILFGRNVASYKFALGKALLEIASVEKTFVTLDELAVPFSRHIVEHLQHTDKQATSSSSSFLDACRKFNRQDISHEQLIATTVKLGFQNVIDAFHVVNQGDVPRRYFIDERKGRNGIVITDELLSLKTSSQFQNLPTEVEARWRLVETAWSLGVASHLLEVKHDRDALFIAPSGVRRVDITSARDALNGYQKGKCFYCFSDVSLSPGGTLPLVDVDHFFPWSFCESQLSNAINANGVWNLVLACPTCNRGTAGKFARVPEVYLLERLCTRNEFFIESHHPLRETLLKQTGTTHRQRRDFLQQMDLLAISMLHHRWCPPNELPAVF